MNQDLLSPWQSQASTAWEARENARARGYLRSLPGYDEVRDRLYQLARDSKFGPVVPAGGRWFQREDHDFARLTVRESLTGPARTILDLTRTAEQAGAPARLVWFAPSPDGRLVAASVEVAGREDVSLVVIDVATGDDLGLDLPYHPAWPVAWLPDSRGFFVDDRNIADGQFTGNDDRIYLHTLGGPGPARPENIPAPRLRFPQVFMSAAGRYAMLVVDNRTDYIYSVESGQWTPFLTQVPGAHLGDFAGDDFVAIVTDQHPRGRIVRIPMATRNDPSTWTSLVPESDDVLLHLQVFDDRIVVGMLRDLDSHLAMFDLSGKPTGAVPLPAAGTAGANIKTAAVLGDAPFVGGPDEISFVFSTPTTSAVTYRYDLRAGGLTALNEPVRTLANCRTEKILVTSADGRTVPATLLYRHDSAVREPRPTVIEAYGNFGLAMLPSFREMAVPIVEAGGIYVLAHLRGGGEYGQQWWEDGRLGNKQHTFDDLFAVAGKLVSDGWTTPGQLAFHGASGGGLTAGVAIVQRPELFAAVVARSPVLDLLTRDGDPLQDSIASREYGDVADTVQRAWMRAYSPVEHVTTGTAYPSCLFVTGENDARCKVWQSRKMAVLLSSATSSPAPILLRVHAGRGHAAVGARSFAEETAEWLTFIGNRIGLQLARLPGKPAHHCPPELADRNHHGHRLQHRKGLGAPACPAANTEREAPPTALAGGRLGGLGGQRRRRSRGLFGGRGHDQRRVRGVPQRGDIHAGSSGRAAVGEPVRH